MLKGWSISSLRRSSKKHLEGALISYGYHIGSNFNKTRLYIVFMYNIVMKILMYLKYFPDHLNNYWDNCTLCKRNKCNNNRILSTGANSVSFFRDNILISINNNFKEYLDDYDFLLAIY